MEPAAQAGLRVRARWEEHAEQAVWNRAILTEATRAMGRQTAAALVDLKKAFETTDRDLLWDSAIRHGFPRRRVALLLQCYGGRRSIKFGAMMGAAI